MIFISVSNLTIPFADLKLLKKGDRVVMPFNVACGHCLNCEEGRSAFCTEVNPGFVRFSLFADAFVLTSL